MNDVEISHRPDAIYNINSKGLVYPKYNKEQL